MRLYINKNEVPFLKTALEEAITRTNTPIVAYRLSDLLERVILCEELQHNINRSTLV